MEYAALAVLAVVFIAVDRAIQRGLERDRELLEIKRRLSVLPLVRSVRQPGWKDLN